MTTARPIPSPLAITAGAPTIVFPKQLVAELGDDEIGGALAHEVAHFRLQRPAWCSSGNLRALSIVNPFAAVMASQLRHEEERHATTSRSRPSGRRTSMPACW